jgi:hypothetical protein
MSALLPVRPNLGDAEGVALLERTLEALHQSVPGFSWRHSFTLAGGKHGPIAELQARGAEGRLVAWLYVQNAPTRTVPDRLGWRLVLGFSTKPVTLRAAATTSIGAWVRRCVEEARTRAEESARRSQTVAAIFAAALADPRPSLER